MKMKQIIYALLITLMVVSCTGNPTLEIRPSKLDATATGKIDSVNVFIDCSGSMKGYVAFDDKDVEGARQEYKTVVPKLITNIEQWVGKDNLTIWKVKDNKYTKENSPHEFYSNLTNGTIFGGQTTELNEIVSHIISGSKNKLSILITDGVISFGPAVLREKGRMYNVSNKHILQSHLHRALAADTTVSVAIVKYVSDVNGNFYYTCKEEVEYSKKQLKSRPFYVFIFGKKEAVATLLTTENLLPRSEGVFTLTSPPQLEVALFKKKLEKGKDKLNSLLKVTNRKGIITATTTYDKRKDKVFIAGIKKRTVSNAIYKNEKTFFDQLKCNDPNVEIEKLNSIDGEDGIDLVTLNPHSVQDYDHFYKITLDKELFSGNLQDKQLVFYLEPSLDVATSNIDIDYDLATNIDTLAGKTWGFNLITNAIEAAHPGKQPQGAIFTLTLNKITR
ncbi:MAG: hypothetical protein LBR46_05280 [Prevotella sp.]|jgi:hypothetical protein|nr:hypothetical protein [Prevotella sp.]